MRAAIGGSVALLGALLALGWTDRSWTTAAGLLLLACVGVCIWAVRQDSQTERETQRTIARLADARRQEEHRRTDPPEHT